MLVEKALDAEMIELMGHDRHGAVANEERAQNFVQIGREMLLRDSALELNRKAIECGPFQSWRGNIRWR